MLSSSIRPPRLLPSWQRQWLLLLLKKVPDMGSPRNNRSIQTMDHYHDALRFSGYKTSFLAPSTQEMLSSILDWAVRGALPTFVENLFLLWDSGYSNTCILGAPHVRPYQTHKKGK